MIRLVFLLCLMTVLGCHPEAKESDAEDQRSTDSLGVLSYGLSVDEEEFYHKLEKNKGRDSIRLHSVGIDTLPSAFYELTHAKKISLDCTTPYGVCYLSSKIAELKELEELVFIKTNLTRLPPEIGQLQKLRVLVVSGGAKLESVPEEIGQLENLVTLNLWRNNLTTLPGSIQNLKNLKELNLIENDFSQMEKDRIRGLLPGCHVRFEH